MGNENLETIVYVEHGGGITLFKLENKKRIYLLKHQTPLGTGYQIELVKTGRAKLDKYPTTYVWVKEMIIHPDEKRRTIYKEKSFNCITLWD